MWGNDVLDVFPRQSFIIHRIGTALVAMTHGKLFEASCIEIGEIAIFDHSLPYLDPTDPFFQKVGSAILNEVCSFQCDSHLHLIIDYYFFEHDFPLLCLRFIQ